MAVARYATTTAVQSGYDTALTTNSVSVSGNKRAVLLFLQLYASGDAPSNLAAVFDYGGTNQAMTLVDSRSSGGYHFYIFGLVNPTAASGTARATWTNNAYGLAQVSTWNGVLQTSAAAAFTNAAFAENTNSGPCQVTVSSASGNAVAAQHMVTSAGYLSTVNDTELFAKTTWYSDIFASAGNNAAGAASVTLDCTLSGTTSWFAHGINIVAYQGDPISAAFAGEGGLTAAVERLDRLAIYALLAGESSLGVDFQQLLAIQHLFAANGSLAADLKLVVAPPYVGATANKGTGIKEMLTTNLNAQMEMLLSPNTLAGRASANFGNAEAITPQSPLVLEDGKLSIDIDALKILLGL
jgi:hypothetical protein